MKPTQLTIKQLARDLAVLPNRISAIVNGTRSITADIALRLSTYFNIFSETWLASNLITTSPSPANATATKSPAPFAPAPPHKALEIRTRICVALQITPSKSHRRPVPIDTKA